MFIERPPKWFRRLFPGALFRMPADPESPKVYLTFDDGPIPEVTPWVLDVLDLYEVKASFFMVGENVERNPGLLEDVMSRGHCVGNHTLHHMKGMGKSVKTYLNDAIEGSLLTGSQLFRPPHGLLSPSQLRKLKKFFKVVMYDVVTRDYSSRLDANEVVENVKNYTRDGSIIVFHDSLKSLPRLRKALPESLSWLRDQGYEFKTISQVI